jgi:hypothetical protein
MKPEAEEPCKCKGTSPHISPFCDQIHRMGVSEKPLESERDQKAAIPTREEIKHQLMHEPLKMGDCGCTEPSSAHFVHVLEWLTDTWVDERLAKLTAEAERDQLRMERDRYKESFDLECDRREKCLEQLKAAREERDAAWNELGEVLSWAIVEKAPLRQQEMDSIRRVLARPIPAEPKSGML